MMTKTRKLLITLIISVMVSIMILVSMFGCAGGNYTLKGQNNAEPTETIQVIDEPNVAKQVFPWVAWASIVGICVTLLFIGRSSSSSEANDK